MIASEHPASSTPAGFLTAVLASSLATKEELEQALSTSPRPETTDDLARILVNAGVLTRFQADRLLAGKPDGLLLGPYEVLEPTGRDQVGQVFRARHRTMNRLASIKVVAAELTSDHEACTSFEADLRSAARLGHPNVVTVYDINRFGDRLYLVLEYVDAVGSDGLVQRNGPLPIAVACEVVRQAALGVHHAHEKGIVHGALTPACVLVGQGKRGPDVKLSNFGFGRLPVPVSGSEPLSADALDYRAPELAESTGSASPAADMYSLGCILVYLLTGESPSSLTAKTGRGRRGRRKPLDLQELRPRLPRPIADLVRSLLADTPRERPASARDVAAALQPYVVLDDVQAMDYAPRVSTICGIGCGSTLSGLVPTPGDRPGISFAFDETSPWAALADSTVDEIERTSADEVFQLPPAPRPQSTGLGSLSTFVVLGLATTVTMTIVLVVSVLMRQMAR